MLQSFPFDVADTVPAPFQYVMCVPLQDLGFPAVGSAMGHSPIGHSESKFQLSSLDSFSTSSAEAEQAGLACK